MRFWGKKLLLGLIVMTCVGVSRGQTEYKSLYQAIYRTYYDSVTGLYMETNNKAADEHPHSYLWPLCALVQAANEMEVLHPGRPYLEPVMKAIDQYYSVKHGIAGYDSYVVKQGGGDRFYDDNQWIGLAYMDAYARTRRKVFLEKSVEIYRFMMSGYDTVTGGGLYWKEGDKSTKNTCSNGPGILLALDLYRATGEKPYLDTALVLYDWVNKVLQSPSGVYYDNIRTKDGKIARQFYTYNTGTMLQANVILYTLTKKAAYLDEAHRLAAAGLKTFFKNGRWPGNYWFNAVLLRGYQDLYLLDKDKTYIEAFIKDADGIRDTETDAYGLAGPGKTKKLLDQAGLLEILARLAEVNAVQ
ncbi:MAG: hypothetical protein BGO55_07850 [Sphingobacteriales bacterium 50-39]|nr:MAG: hypothetical protein BGO55_07850 [Sphingobacteriales bacterium 50-39]